MNEITLNLQKKRKVWLDMKSVINLFLIGSDGTTIQKLLLLGLVVLFALIVYAFFPRLAEKKIREYHEQCEIEEEEADELSEEMTGDINEGAKK